MPIYEYKCETCDEEFEKLVLNSSYIPECPKCNSKEVKRLLSLFGYSSGGKFTSSQGRNSGCDSCSSSNCSSCH